MGQDRKKKKKLLDKKFKQKKFTAKYGVYNGPKKFVVNEPEVAAVPKEIEQAEPAKKDEIEVKQENTVLQESALQNDGIGDYGGIAEMFNNGINVADPDFTDKEKEEIMARVNKLAQEKNNSYQRPVFNFSDLQQRPADRPIFTEEEKKIILESNAKPKETVADKPKEEQQKSTFSGGSIPGMKDGELGIGVANNVPERTYEERKAMDIEFATKNLAELNKHRGGTTEDKQARAKLRAYYQSILDKYKTDEERYRESLELSAQKTLEQREKEAREKELNDNQNSGIHDKEAPPKQEPRKIQPVKPEPPKPEIKDFYTKLYDRMGSTEVTAQVKSEITDIIKAAGITEQQEIDKFVEKSYSDGREYVNLIYAPDRVSETKISTDATSFFYNAYKSLDESNLSAANQIIAAQKIANVMIKNYSPVAFADKGVDHYANNYVLNNRETLEAQLGLLGFVDTNAMAEEVYATLEGRQIKKEEPPKEEPAVDPDAVDMAAFTKNLQPILDDTEQYKGYNVYRKLAIKNILREAGVDVGEASDPLGFADVLKDAYAPEKLSREVPQQMRDVTKSLFVSTYNALTQKGINPKNKIEITQKLTNEFIEHFSPAFFNENLLKYANNYVINDKALFRECLTTLKFPEKEIKAIVDDQIDGTRLHNNAQLFMGMPSLNARTNSNISDILKAADVGADKINALEINEILTDAYALNKIPNASIPMRDVAKNVFISTYDAMTKKGVVTKNKVDTAQKIADELLKNYSPVAYTDKKLNEYANNYVLSDKDLLRECLTTLKVPEKEINAIVGIAPEKKQENTEKKAPGNDTANVAVFMSKLNDFNKMYKLNINADNFASSVTDAWVLLKKSDNQSQSYGRKMMKDLFKDTLKQAFALERDTSYNEHRLPDYNEIIKSSNDLLRSAMYAFTDLYHDPKSASWFDKTAFGCLSASEMADQTTGKSLWDMDQKSDEAWEIQSKEAKDITEKWKKEANPYEKMIKEMNDLVANAKKNGNYDRREVGLKLAAAEWLLTNDSRMMIEDPEDPINPIPNWGNRYWKTLIQTRDALGIDKHTSMRDQIQQDYAAAAKSVRSYAYHERQISDHITDPKERAKFDSIDKQKEQFATQSAHVTLTEDNKKKSDDEIVMTSDRVQISVKSLDQRLLMKKELKSYHFVSERTAELTIESQNKGAQM